jgi:hypothetical protein
VNQPDEIRRESDQGNIFFFFRDRKLTFSTDDGFDNAAVNPSFTSSRWQGPLDCACLIYHQCAMSAIMRITLYCTCPLLQGNSWLGASVASGLSGPCTPVGLSLAVCTSYTLSLTIPTCAPGAVRHPTTAAPWRTAVWCSNRQCWATVCIDKHLL